MHTRQTGFTDYECTRLNQLTWPRNGREIMAQISGKKMSGWKIPPSVITALWMHRSWPCMQSTGLKAEGFLTLN